MEHGPHSESGGAAARGGPQPVRRPVRSRQAGDGYQRLTRQRGRCTLPSPTRGTIRAVLAFAPGPTGRRTHLPCAVLTLHLERDWREADTPQLSRTRKTGTPTPATG